LTLRTSLKVEPREDSLLRVKKWLRKYSAAALDLAYPFRCPVCNASVKRSKNFVCENCLGELEGLVSRQKTDDPYGLTLQSEGVEVRALADFEFPLSVLVHACKYKYNPLLLKSLTESLFEFASLEIYGEVLIPVPLHPVRKRERGYNQSKLIAEVFSSKTNIPLEPGLLIRKKPTQGQAGLHKDARHLNVKGAFEVPEKMKSELFRKRIVLVDDVCTTGTTLSECAAPLIDAGASCVSAVVLGIRELKLK